MFSLAFQWCLKCTRTDPSKFRSLSTKIFSPASRRRPVRSAVHAYAFRSLLRKKWVLRVVSENKGQHTALPLQAGQIDIYCIEKFMRHAYAMGNATRFINSAECLPTRFQKPAKIFGGVGTLRMALFFLCAYTSFFTISIYVTVTYVECRMSRMVRKKHFEPCQKSLPRLSDIALWGKKKEKRKWRAIKYWRK